MTDTESWVNGVCDGIVKAGYVRLYRDLYKDLRERLPCDVACGLVAEGLRRTRSPDFPEDGSTARHVCGARARAVASLSRLARYDEWVRSYEDLTGNPYVAGV